jgi:aspartyl-tRNA(Asn)/glutamyl-tRNA(Gln) amidotransferase subunit B
LIVTEKWVSDIRSALPELANDKAKRFVETFGIPEYDAKVLTAEKSLADFYESAVKIHNSPKPISNWIMVELLAKLNNDEAELSNCKIRPEHIAKLVKLIEAETISGKIAKDVFAEMYATGADPEKIVADKGLVQVTNTKEIEDAVDKVISENPGNVEKYKAGKVQLIGFFVGEVMKLTKGKASPKIVNEILRKKL